MKKTILDILNASQATPDKIIAEDTKLCETGLDSILFIEILVEIEKKFNIRFSDNELNVYDYKTAGDIIALAERKKMKRKIIKNIKPYNLFSFGTCYHHQLIPVIEKYGFDKRLVLGSRLALYDFNEQNSVLSTYNLELYDNKRLEQVTGIHFINKRNIKDICTEIIKSIDRGSPVIVSSDCYCLKYRPDTYKKLHRLHYILVYGYDLGKKTFIINEHEYMNSFHYTSGEVPFKLIETAFGSYVKRFKDKSGFDVLKFKKIKPDNNVEPIDFLAEIRKHADKLAESKKALDKCMNYIIGCTKSKSKLLDNAGNIIDFLAALRMPKQTQIYQFELFGADEDTIDKIKRIQNNYIFLFGIINRATVLKTLDKLTSSKIKERCKEIKEIEFALHDFLMGGPQ